MRRETEEMVYRELRFRRLCSNAVAWLFIGPMLLFIFAFIAGKLA
jgi:hypothetical protein